MYLNRLTQQLIHNYHLTFKQKCRSLFMQIFGHEAYVNAANMAVTSHCTVFDIDIYRLSSLDRSQLANRKLWNPFKWIEFLLVVPPEIVLWWFHRSPIKITPYWAKRVWRWAYWIGCAEKTKYSRLTFKAGIVKMLAYILKILEIVYRIVCLIIAPSLHLIINIATGLVRRPLAPVRYIIRPSIEVMQDYPYVFLAMIAATLGIVAYFPVFASSFLISHLPSIVSSFLLAGTISSQIIVTAVLWSSLLKIISLVCEIGDAYIRKKNSLEPKEQPVIQFAQASTEIVTAALHAINPKKTQVKRIEEQDCSYSLALFTGTESLFFPKARNIPEERSKVIVWFSDLEDYAGQHARLRRRYKQAAGLTPPIQADRKLIY